MAEELRLLPMSPSDYVKETMERFAGWACAGDGDSPAGNNCHNICDYMVRKLEDTLVFAWQVPQEEEQIKRAHHSFLMFGGEGKWVADAQYLQYVSVADRGELPTIMFIPIIDKETFCQILKIRFRIPEEFHHLWMDLVFDKQG